MGIMQLLLIDGRLTTSYLANQDLRQLAQARKAWRSIVGQVVTLRPRNAHTPTAWLHKLMRREIVDKLDQARRKARRTAAWPKSWGWPQHAVEEAARRLIVDTWDKVRDGRTGGLPMHTLRRQAAREDYEDAGWDPLLCALEGGKARQLQRMDFGIDKEDLGWHPRLTCASACRLAASFRHMPALVHLNLYGHNISTAGALALAKGLQHTPHLRYLDMCHNRITDEGIQAIAGVFHKLPELESLRISNCGLLSEGAQILGSSFKFLPRLTSLWVSSLSNLVQHRAAADPIFEHLKDLPNLNSFTWAGRIISSQVITLGDQLQCLPKLRELHMWGFHANTDSMEALGAVLVDLPSLEHITINDHPLTLQARMCIEFKITLAACGFREEEQSPGQMDAQREAQESALRRMGHLGRWQASNMTRTLKLLWVLS